MILFLIFVSLHLRKGSIVKTYILNKHWNHNNNTFFYENYFSFLDVLNLISSLKFFNLDSTKLKQILLHHTFVIIYRLNRLRILTPPKKKHYKEVIEPTSKFEIKKVLKEIRSNYTEIQVKLQRYFTPTHNIATHLQPYIITFAKTKI